MNNITGKITGISYKIQFAEKLSEITESDFDINTAPASHILRTKNSQFALSKWVSPKRTRSYPFERVYNTLNSSKKITIIPIVKDEGKAGDRDFIQWDTISLMSLLDVYIIFAYYTDADKHILPNKITNQKLNNFEIKQKIQEIEQYHSSALHWNLNELQQNLMYLIECAQQSYQQIQLKHQVQMHNEQGLNRFAQKIQAGLTEFMQFSRGKAQQAQEREFQTIQPKEHLSTLSKAKITIRNYLGGEYFFTVDEIHIENDMLYLIEAKHSQNGILPSSSDIRDGLLKMILYCNLQQVALNGQAKKSIPVLKLTANQLSGCLKSSDNPEQQELFFQKNAFSEKHLTIINTLIEEARSNQFILQIGEYEHG